MAKEARSKIQAEIEKAMKRKERVALWVKLARGVQVVKKTKQKNGKEVHFIELAPDEEVFRIPPSESALAKLTEYTDGKVGLSQKNRSNAILVEVLEADTPEDVASTAGEAPASQTDRNETDDVPPLVTLDSGEPDESLAATPEPTEAAS